MADDDYGFRFNPPTNGTHGSHRPMTTTVVPHNTKQAAQVLAQNADLLAAMEASINAPAYQAWLDEGLRLTEDVQALETLYGPNAMWKTERDNLMARLAQEVRPTLLADAPIVTDSKGVSKPVPVTEKMVEDGVRVHPEFVAFCAQAKREMDEYHVKAKKLENLDKLLLWANSLIKRARILEPAESEV